MPDNPDSAASWASLSKRERSIATRFAEGLTYQEIGEALFIAPTTVRTHLAAIYRKLDVHNKTVLVRMVTDCHPNEAPRVAGTLQAAYGQPNHGGPPVIAVLPFDNLAGDRRWQPLADGLSDDIITDLARHPDLRVLARTTMSTFKRCSADARAIGRELGANYILEGSVQAGGDRVRVTAQLIDAGTGAHLWADRYDCPQGEPLDIQDQIVERVVASLATWGGRLVRVCREAASRRPPARLKAFELYLLGLGQKHKFTKAGNAEGIRLLSRALELDPSLIRAWTALGLAHGSAAINGFTDEPLEAIKRRRECTEKALALDPADSMARASVGELRAMDGDLAGAADEFQAALAAARGDADALAYLAGSLALVAGDPAQGAELGRRAVRLNPSAPVWYFLMLGRAEYVDGDYRASIKALSQAPLATPATLFLRALAHSQLGETAKVREIAAQLAAEAPNFTVEGFIRAYPVTNPPALAAIAAGVAKAGCLRAMR